MAKMMTWQSNLSLNIFTTENQGINAYYEHSGVNYLLYLFKLSIGQFKGILYFSVFMCIYVHTYFNVFVLFLYLLLI